MNLSLVGDEHRHTLSFCVVIQVYLVLVLQINVSRDECESKNGLAESTLATISQSLPNNLNLCELLLFHLRVRVDCCVTQAHTRGETESRGEQPKSRKHSHLKHIIGFIVF